MLWGELVQKQQEQRSIEAYPSTSMSMLQHADRRMLNEMDKFRTVIMTVQLQRTNSNSDHDEQLPEKPCWVWPSGLLKRVWWLTGVSSEQDAFYKEQDEWPVLILFTSSSVWHQFLIRFFF